MKEIERHVRKKLKRMVKREREAERGRASTNERKRDREH